MIAAPIAPPSDTGKSRPNNRPPDKIAIGGAKISFAARRVGASACQSRSHSSQRRPARSGCFLQRVLEQRPHFVTGADWHSEHARVAIVLSVPPLLWLARAPKSVRAVTRVDRM